MRWKTAMMACWLCAAATSALAAKPEFDDTIRFMGKELHKLGEAELNLLLLDVYDIAAYAPWGRYEPTVLHAIEIRYEMDFSAEELNDETIKQLKRMGGVTTAQERAWRRELERLNLSVEDGERVRLYVLPGEKLVFYKGNMKFGEIRGDEELIRRYPLIWLGENSEYPKITRKILGRD